MHPLCFHVNENASAMHAVDERFCRDPFLLFEFVFVRLWKINARRGGTVSATQRIMDLVRARGVGHRTVVASMPPPAQAAMTLTLGIGCRLRCVSGGVA